MRLPNRKGRRGFLVLGLVVVAAAYFGILAALAAGVDWSIIKFEAVSVAWIGVALGLATANFILRGFRFHLMMRRQTDRARLPASQFAFLSGLTFSATPGRAGDLIRVNLLHRWCRIAPRASLPVCLFDRFLDLAGICVLVPVSIAVAPHLRDVYPEWGWIVAFSLLILAVAAVLPVLAGRLGRRIGGRIGRGSGCCSSGDRSCLGSPC